MVAKWLLLAKCIALMGLAAAPALAADVENSRDSPLLPRLPGSEIAYYRDVRADEIFLLRAPHDYFAISNTNPKDRSGPDWLRVEGAVTQIRYAVAPGTSSFEAMRAYRDMLAARGFTTIFACNDNDCLTGRLRDPYRVGERIDTANTFPSLYETHARHLLARADGPGGPTHVAVLVGEFKDRTTVYLQIVGPERAAAPPPAPPTPRPAPAPAPQAAVCPPFAGEWRNVDPKTRSIPRAILTGTCTETGGTYTMKAWGSCTPKWCEWEPLELSYRPASKQLIGADRTNYSDEAFRVTLDPDGKLRIFSVIFYTDKSGRTRQQIIDVMERAR